jgi:uncharacterized membrane protein
VKHSPAWLSAFSLGIIYLRSSPFFYLEALWAKVFGLSEFTLRFPNLLVNLAAIWVTYLLGKRLFGTKVAILAAVMMSLSNWEIEFSRNARMYALFQLMYLLSVYFFYGGFIEGKKSYQILTIPTWLLTSLIHRLAISLSIFLLIPLLFKNYQHVKKRTLVIGFCIRWHLESSDNY